MPPYAPFIDGSGRSASINFQLDRTQNMYLENRTMAGAKTDKVLIGAPGFTLFYDLGNGPVRGQKSLEGFEFIISGGNVWQKDPTDIFTLLGVCANDGKQCRMVANNNYVFFESAGLGYVIGGGIVQLVPAPPWTTLIDVAFLHGYFIGLDDTGQKTGGRFFISSPDRKSTRLNSSHRL